MEPKQWVEAVSNMQRGDLEAFQKIFHSFSGQAQGWALQIVRDSYLSEDVVQESFLQMRDKIHHLQDPAKFPAWFRQIVRRTAMNHIRGLSNRTLLMKDIPDPVGLSERNQKFEDDPLEYIQQIEDGKDILQDALKPLPKKARSMILSHALEEATPDELAAQFNMKKSNVYNILSRSRVKANDERYSREIQRHLMNRRRLGISPYRQLPAPVVRRPYALLSLLIWELLRIAGEPDWTLTDIMGMTGDAFRMNIPQNCNWRGISTFDWSYVTQCAFESLGISGRCFGRPERTTSPEHQITVLSMIQDSIDRGLPAIIWNLNRNQFGFVYGYNDEERTISYTSYQSHHTFRYEQLGRTCEEPALFVATIRGRVTLPASEQETLTSIVNCCKGKEPQLSGFAFGLQGYAQWMEAVENGRLDLQGHAYKVAILAEARKQGALYLQRLSEKAERAESQLKLEEASLCFRSVSEAFEGIYPSFPFGYGGSNANRLSSIRSGLLTALEAEKEGICLLESLIR
ncbi:RNA polymerase sigma factor [Cohnella nanjingensis]|uniref:Sigma-70 family RNA polymerase sigma factor n=1 Tax=Cohnella nanjingensis TaxID=1387779 RepID=A0A7X0RQR3_9BACL|nr:sigma-70 family RNA polymerase sigma factor [Cohnella nanjingensis]MBB6671825.1 sigma-70 family RNA polymerase sigma factor [Cohnella nanjingensis]